MLSHAALNNWRLTWVVHHAVPLVPRWALVLCDDLLDNNDLWTSVILLFQSYRGLRPGEALALFGRDLVTPEENPSLLGCGPMLLGVRQHTKSGRPQNVKIFDASSFPSCGWRDVCGSRHSGSACCRRLGPTILGSKPLR